MTKLVDADLDAVAGGCRHHHHGHRAHHAGNFENPQPSGPPQPGPQPLADLAEIMMGARIKF